MTGKLEIPVTLNDKTLIYLTIWEESAGTLFRIDDSDAIKYDEAPFQLVEGKTYEYVCPPGYELKKTDMVRPSKMNASIGIITTGNYVGSLEIDLLYGGETAGKLILEIRSFKAGYRDDYRRMLADITAKCTDLLMRHTSAVNQTFTVDADSDSRTLYQRFVFVDSIIRSDRFAEALQRINSNPAKQWEASENWKNVYNIRRIGNSVIRQMVTGKKRLSLSGEYDISKKISSVPDKVIVSGKRESIDIPENRFVKFVIEAFIRFCTVVSLHRYADERLKRNALSDIDLLSRYLQLPLLQEVSRLDKIPFHSTVLQNREGYREVLQVYLMFNMAASLIWSGGEEVYKAGKKDVAVLYEYWVFFKLLDLIEVVFGIALQNPEEIFAVKNDGTLELGLQRGKRLKIKGIYSAGQHRFCIKFYYNRTFTGGKLYPKGGSWTKSMRPDYTLSVYPEGMTSSEAEEKEMIMHIHFDAKYKVDANYGNIFDVEADGIENNIPHNAQADYKSLDLLKMHAYKDGIRRSLGAYIIYPGRGKQIFRSFEEILPGIGAFSLSPRTTDNSALKEFLYNVASYLVYRADCPQLQSPDTPAEFSHTAADTF